LLARIPSIAVAMICAWALNRTLTFASGTAPSVAEFGRYAAVAAAAALVNYGVFTIVLLLRPETLPLYALCVSSAIAAVLSYSGYRWFVF
jgi:putative flippase GtrA